MKVLVGLPTDNNLKSEFVNSLIALLFKTYNHFKHNVAFSTEFLNGVRTDKNRNIIVQKFLEEDFDYLLFLDTDMVYPADMLIKYIESGKELVGGVYYKRSAPHYPVVYKFSGNPDTPFNAIDPTMFERNKLIEVDGLGTGGMFIAKSVFNKLEVAGQNPWFYYGENYHLPTKSPGQTTHDLMFCKKCRESGVQIYVHTGVQMGHITEKVIGEEDWITTRDDDLVDIIVPCYGEDSVDNIERLCKSVMNETFGLNFRLRIIIDGDEKLAKILKEKKLSYPQTEFLVQEKNLGFANTVNAAIKDSNASYFIYLGNDVIFGKDWLKEALRVYNEAFPQKDGLLTFNDGKWFGKIAAHGLIHRNFLQHTGDTLFYPGYFHYHCDLDLTEIAKKNDKLVYAYNSVVYHMQYKEGRAEKNKGTDKAWSAKDKDWEVFLKRKEQGFPKY